MLLALLARLGSLKLTLVLLLILLLAVINAYHSVEESFRGSHYGWLLTLPLAALSLNLIAAICANPSFRVQPGLLLFHLALLALVMLAGVGQLTNLKGWTEVATGAAFEGRLTGVQAGPLHPGTIDRVHFVNRGFEIHYAPGPVRRHTFNRVEWQDRDGRPQQAIIGDQVPLIIDGYRFYTTFNKGFTPRFLWRDRSGRVALGGVNLPAWPLHEFNQAVEWQLPGSQTRLWVQLEFDEQILSQSEPSLFRTPRDYRLIVRRDAQRWELQPGDELSVDGGVLVLQELGTWMGYQVYYDQTRYWMLAAALLAVLSLSWHFWHKFGRSDWRRTERSAPGPAEGTPTDA